MIVRYLTILSLASRGKLSDEGRILSLQTLNATRKVKHKTLLYKKYTINHILSFLKVWSGFNHEGLELNPVFGGRIRLILRVGPGFSFLDKDRILPNGLIRLFLMAGSGSSATSDPSFFSSSKSSDPQLQIWQCVFIQRHWWIDWLDKLCISHCISDGNSEIDAHGEVVWSQLSDLC